MTDELKTHYKLNGQIHLCGLPISYKGVQGLSRTPLVTCIRCQRSLLINGTDMVKYQKRKVIKRGGRKYVLPGKVIPA